MINSGDSVALFDYSSEAFTLYRVLNPFCICSINGATFLSNIIDIAFK